MNQSALAERSDPCLVRLDVFDGPLDLLLGLIKEQQLDIATVSLASVAEQYLAYVRVMESLDVEVAAEYLVIAATLVFLKSRALLPAIPAELAEVGEESPEEVEERLRRRLIAYSKYRELGDALRTRQGEAGAVFYREGGDATGDFEQRYRIDADRLARAFLAMLRNARPEKRTIVRERISLLAQMDYIVRSLKERGETTFAALCNELGMTREIVIATFLAVLELMRRNRIRIEQPAAFEDIIIALHHGQTTPV
ncbi:MAG: segregation/condensation protein A [Candidatus Eremiobacteraeota bacterium]|nr:segregation/condensation protein A [Candidatus Eremiobacteraeota bacterium]